MEECYLIKIRFFFLAMHEHLITPCIGSCHVTFLSYLTAQSYTRLLNTLPNQTTALSF